MNSVQDIFRRVASRYDLMNDLMSLGLHRQWKDRFVQKVSLQNRDEDLPVVLDMATGTGDIAQALWKRFHPIQLILCDLNPAMMAAGREKLPEASWTWICGDASCLPVTSNSVDLYTIAFGLRNVTDKQQALREAFRVVRPGGWFYCLEFSQVTSPWMDGLYRLYSQMIPCLGGVVAGDRPAYQYLVDSIRNFPGPTLLEGWLQDVGFEATGFEQLTQGIVAIHWGCKPL